jgi:hypothetical protein
MRVVETVVETVDDHTRIRRAGIEVWVRSITVVQGDECLSSFIPTKAFVVIAVFANAVRVDLPHKGSS